MSVLEKLQSLGSHNKLQSALKISHSNCSRNLKLKPKQTFVAKTTQSVFILKCAQTRFACLMATQKFWVLLFSKDFHM